MSVKRSNLFARTLILCAALAFAAGGASAATVTGATGLVTLPTADVLPDGSLEVGARYADDVLGLTAVYGAFGDAEIGINTLRTDVEPAGIGIVLKGVLLHETASSPGVAIGFESGRGYVVASKRLAPRVRLHAGYLFGERPGPGAGIAYSFTTVSVSQSVLSSPATTLFAEYTPDGLNVGARFLFGPSSSVDVGLLDMRRLTAGAAFRWTF